MIKTKVRPSAAMGWEKLWQKYQGAVLLTLTGLCGFLLSGGLLLGRMAPFGVAFTAAQKKERLIAAAMGTILGYLFLPGEDENSRLLLASVLVVIAHWLIPPKFAYKHRHWLGSATAFGAVFLPGAALASLSGYFLYDVVIALSEAVLAAGSTFFFARAMALLARRERLAALNGKDTACLTVAYAMAVMSLGAFTMGDVSIGRVAAVTSILLAARCGREAGGAVAGVTGGVVMGVLGGDVSFLGASYGFGGLLAGIFAPLGPVVQSLVFTAANGIAAMILGSEYQAYSVWYEILFGSALFLLIPASAVERMVFWNRTRSDACSQTARQVVLEKLRYASAALCDIGEATRQVSRKMASPPAGSVADVFAAAVDEICRDCKEKTSCWAKNYSAVMDGFNDLSAVLQRKGSVAPADFPGYLGKSCVRRQEMAGRIGLEYERFCGKREANSRSQALRGVVTDQFQGLGAMLDSLSGQLQEIRQLEYPLGDRIIKLLERENLSPQWVSAYTDAQDRLTVEASIPAFRLARMDKTSVTLGLSELCRRNMQLPSMETVEASARLCWIERTCYDVETAGVQHPSKGETLCGDAMERIDDRKGQVHLLLSDGMGSGKRAALDSAMTVKLLKKLVLAGFPFDAALQLVNAALLIKSEEESLSTVDVASVDLYTGSVSFLKAGAAPTFVCRDGAVTRVEGISMPAGILKGVDFAKSTLKLRPGDWIIMVSDGVLLDGGEWIYDQIKLCARKSAGEMAQSIWDTASSRLGDHDDDATVLACRVVENR